MRWLSRWLLCFALALPIGGGWMLWHAASHHPPAAPVAQLVTFAPGTYSSYGTPSFEVDATNGNASPMTVHSIRVRFVNDRTAQVITEVTEPVNVTVPAGQDRALTYPAPQAVAGPDGPPVNDRDISVTVEGWS